MPDATNPMVGSLKPTQSSQIPHKRAITGSLALRIWRISVIGSAGFPDGDARIPCSVIGNSLFRNRGVGEKVAEILDVRLVMCRIQRCKI